MKHRIAAPFLSLLMLVSAAGAAPGKDIHVRIDGNVLRKATGRLVLSLSSFELSGAMEVVLENRGTGERKAVALSSVYSDASYTELLPPSFYDAIEPRDWIPYVVWTLPDDRDALRARLLSVYEYQNELRRGMGRALLEGGGGTRLTSRLTLNKIEKFHRIARVMAAESIMAAIEKDELGSFLDPVRIRIEFNPFEGAVAPDRATSIHDVREVIYWEAHRVLTLHFGIGEGLVDLLFDSPGTVKSMDKFDAGRGLGPSDLLPGVTIEGASINCALYLQRQDIGDDVKRLIRAKEFLDPFITDRPAVDLLVNEGKVLGIRGNRVAVSFAPPFMKKGETLLVKTGADARGWIPVVLGAPIPEAGYTLSEELPEESVALVRTGMPVRRK